MKFGDRMTRMDFWILWKFMHLSHWVDWRFHINQFDLAAQVMSAGLAMNLAASVYSALHIQMRWLGIFTLISSGFLLWLYTSNLKALSAASRAYERDPAHIPRAAIIYYCYPQSLRITALFLGLFLWLIGLLADLLPPITWPHAILDGWLFVIQCAYYIAGGIPSGRGTAQKEGARTTGRTAGHGEGIMLTIAGGILIALLVVFVLVFALIMLHENQPAGITLLLLVAGFVAFLIFY